MTEKKNDFTTAIRKIMTALSDSARKVFSSRARNEKTSGEKEKQKLPEPIEQARQAQQEKPIEFGIMMEDEIPEPLAQKKTEEKQAPEKPETPKLLQEKIVRKEEKKPVKKKEKPVAEKAVVKEQLPNTKIGRMIETKQLEKAKSRKKKKIRRKLAAKKAAEKRRRKHEEIVERLDSIERHVSGIPEIMPHVTSKRLKNAVKAAKKSQKDKLNRAAIISWEAGKEIVEELKRIEKKTSPRAIMAQQAQVQEKTGMVPETKTTDDGITFLQFPRAAQPQASVQPQVVSQAPIKQFTPMQKAVQEEQQEAEQKALEEQEKPMTLDEQIELTKRMIQRERYEFFKRQISEEEFKRRTLELSEKLRLLEEKKKVLGGRTLETPFGKKNFLAKTVEEKASGKISADQIKNIETRLAQLAEKYNIPKKEMISDIQKIDTGKIIEDFDKLITLIEIEHRQKNTVQERETMKFESVPKSMALRQKEKTAPVDKEITVQMLETDFDKVQMFIKQKGSATAGEIARALGINKKTVYDCCKVLEQNALVKVNYPAFGEMFVTDINFDPKAEKALQKKQLAKEQAGQEKKSVFQKFSMFGRKKGSG